MLTALDQRQAGTRVVRQNPRDCRPGILGSRPTQLRIIDQRHHGARLDNRAHQLVTRRFAACMAQSNSSPSRGDLTRPARKARNGSSSPNFAICQP